MTEIKCEVTPEVNKLLNITAEKFGVRKRDLCGVWLSLIDPNSEKLAEKIRAIRIEKEMNRLSDTRNALMSRLRSKGVLQQIDNMTAEELERLVRAIGVRKKHKP